tara:strand:+ start:520 stop:768 length:249 start_codon:yes stop_codon:yes gene_type:complete
MTKYKNILRNKEFDEKIGSLKLNISEKLKEHKYELKNLEITELFGYNNFDGVLKIYPSQKCPEEIKGIILDIIKTEFNDTNG